MKKTIQFYIYNGFGGFACCPYCEESFITSEHRCEKPNFDSEKFCPECDKDGYYAEKTKSYELPSREYICPQCRNKFFLINPNYEKYYNHNLVFFIETCKKCKSYVSPDSKICSFCNWSKLLKENSI